MNKTNVDITPRKAAIIAGTGFLISFLGAIFTGLYVNDLIVTGDAAATARNIIASPVLFRAGIISWLLVILGDLVRAWALWVFFREVNRSLALLAAWFMLVHDAIFGSALINLVSGAEMLNGGDYLMVLGTAQLHAQVIHLFNSFDFGFQIGLFFFSFHLGILGYLVFKSGYVPRILGVLLYVAFLGYLTDSVVRILVPEYPEILWMVLMGPCLIGELALVGWLVIKGGRNNKTP